MKYADNQALNIVLGVLHLYITRVKKAALLFYT